MENAAVHTAAQWQVIAAVVIFLLAYAFIISEKINRALIAILGAVIMVALGIVGLEDAYRTHIEWQTIFLLVGMMILVGIANKTGVFQFVAIKAAQLTKGEPTRILVVMSALTAIGSAFLDNVTTVLLVVPITFSITRILKVNPIPFLIAEIIASNVGGTATLIGDPPNIMIGSATHLTFNDFIRNLTPIVIVIMIVTILILRWLYRNQLKVEEGNKQLLMTLKAEDYITDRVLMKKSVAVLILTIIGFILHSLVNLEPAVVAVAGATILMLIGVKEHDLEEVFHSVEWITIFFFIGLFVLVGGLIETGIIKALAEQAISITGGNLTSSAMLILWVSGLASATIDNIPFVATMIPLVQDMGAAMNIGDNLHALNPVWWSLALGACLGGNGTLIGASANVIVAGMATREGERLSYMDFLKIGAPLTVLHLILATGYVYFILL